MNTILNIIVPPILYSLYALPLLYIIYFCSRIIKYDKDVKSFILEKNNVFFIIIYMIFPPVLWFRLLHFFLKEKYIILSFAITLFLFFWFIGLLCNLSCFLGRIPYNIYYINIFVGTLFYMLPVLFIIRYFQKRKN